MPHINKWVGVLTVLIVTLSGTSIPCPAKDALIFGNITDAPPLSYEENGVIKGFFSDVFREAARRAGFEVSLALYPVKRLEAYSQTGEIDGVAALLHTKEREQYLIYSQMPIMVSRGRVFVKKGREFPFSAISDLKGKKIGIIAGWAMNNAELTQALREGTLQAEAVALHDQNLKKLMAGRVDCIIGTENLTWYHAHKLGIAENLVALHRPVAEYSVFVGVSQFTKNIRDPEAFLKKIDAALREIQSDGTYENFERQYKVTSSE